MSLLIIASNKDITSWIKAFKGYDHTLDIQVYPNVQNKDKIIFAIVWSKNNINFQEYKNLKCISSMGAGVDHILCNKTIQNINIVKIIDEQLVNSMWQYLLSVVMNILTNHYKYIRQQKKKVWKLHEVKEIKDTTIGVLGLGQLGNKVSQKFNKMGFNVKGYSKNKKEIRKIETFIDIDLFCKNVDILINLLPLTNETHGFLDKKLFSKLNNEAYIINVGRGQHLNEKDLIDALNNKKLSGATLDVFDNEPLESSHPFWKDDRIIITPHSASITNPQSVVTQIMTNYRRVKEDKEPLNQINFQKGY